MISLREYEVVMNRKDYQDMIKKYEFLQEKNYTLDYDNDYNLILSNSEISDKLLNIETQLFYQVEVGQIIKNAIKKYYAIEILKEIYDV
jgi:hypothetical protein